MGDLTFGASKDDVKRLLGAPAEEETFDNGDVRWWYSALQTNVYFGYDNSLRLDLLETTNHEARLLGVVAIGLEARELVGLFQKNDFGPPEIVEEGAGEVLYRYPGCNIYVEASVVTSIQLTVLFDEIGDNVEWPKEEKGTF